jgi:GLPGLI family protein
MKHIILFIFLISSAAHAQENVRVEYQVRFNDQFDRGRSDRMHTGYLLINNSESRYFMVQKSAYVQKDEHDISMITDTTQYIYTNQGKGVLIAEEMNLKGKRYFVSDSLYPMKWEFTGDEKMIDSLRCTKANCYFRGRYYTAWFTTDIPLPFGPWKMGGLPGLVVELQDMDENLVIQLTSVGKTSETPIPPRDVSVTMDDHVAEIKKLINRIRANNRASSTGDCITCQQQSVVEFYTWEKFPE